MYLAFHKEKETPLAPAALMGRLQARLREQDYQIEEQTDNKLKFRGVAVFRALDKGRFEVSAHGPGKSVVRFTYGISILPELIVVAVTAAIFYLADGFDRHILLLAVPLFIQLLIRISTLRRACAALFKTVTDA